MFKVGDEVEAVFNVRHIVAGQRYSVTNVYEDVLQLNSYTELGFHHEYFKLVQGEVKPKPHVHAELIKQWADDPSLIIQCREGAGNWAIVASPSWHTSLQYRINPDNSVEIESLNISMAQTLKVITEAEATVEVIQAKIKVLKEE